MIRCMSNTEAMMLASNLDIKNLPTATSSQLSLLLELPKATSTPPQLGRMAINRSLAMPSQRIHGPKPRYTARLQSHEKD